MFILGMLIGFIARIVFLLLLIIKKVKTHNLINGVWMECWR